MEPSRPIDNLEYKEHEIFQELDSIISFYRLISFSVMGFVTRGTTRFLNIDTYFFSSIQGTVESIKIILQAGKINDAYALLRKYHDSVIINIYSNLYLDANENQKNFKVKKIDDWVNDKAPLPSFKEMNQYIKDSKKMENITNLLCFEEYRQMRDRCNDHTHYNFYHYALLNDSEIHLSDRVNALNLFLKDLELIVILHLSYIFYLNGHYMMSSDYADYMDVGITPPENSQYYVAPFIQGVFNDILKKNRPDIAQVIKIETEMDLK